MTKLAFSVEEFCESYGFSRAWLYLKWQEGKGPRKTKAGRRTLILTSDAEKWIASLAEEVQN